MDFCNEKIRYCHRRAGIAGSALSAALADSGLSIVVLDKRTNSLDTARGDAIQPVMCETLNK